MRPACVLIEMPFVWQPKSCWADDVDARVLFFFTGLRAEADSRSVRGTNEA